MYAPSIGMNFDGRQEIFGLTGAGVYHNWQLAPGGPWSGWALLTTPSNSGDTNSADLAFFMSDAQDNAYYTNNKGQTCPSKMPNLWRGPVNGFTYAWPCGALVNTSFVGFDNDKPLTEALENWDDTITAYFSRYMTGTGTNFALPVVLSINSGGPQAAKVDRVGDLSIKDPITGQYGRAINVSQKPDKSQRLATVVIHIIEGIEDETGLKDVFAHELGHTFGLLDCSVSAVDAHKNPLYDCSKTVMATNIMGDWTTFNSTAKNASYTNIPSSQPPTYQAPGFELLSGPTSCDMQIIDQNLPDYHQCFLFANNIPVTPSCTNGTALGFMDTGSSGQYTCNGAPCDGCNSACSNFAPQNCSGGGGGGQTCSNWCGNVCMDNAVCSCPGEVPSCQENSGGWFPACNNSCSPVVIDAFNEGFHLTNMANGVKFRIAPNGPLLQMSWPDQQYRNGWLALDRNANGIIDDFTELFGNMTPQPSSDDPNGYHALAVFDDPMNGGNGVIDPGDSVYAQLRLWIDANHNGISEPDELYTLPETGIFRIDLKYHLSKYVDANGNTFRYRSRIWDEASHGHDVCYDVFLSVQPIQSGSN